MAYGSPSSVLSVVALLCAAAAFFGHGPMLAIAGMFCGALGMARGEGLAGPAVLIALVVLVLSFLLPVGVALGGVRAAS